MSKASEPTLDCTKRTKLKRILRLGQPWPIEIQIVGHSFMLLGALAMICLWSGIGAKDTLSRAAIVRQILSRAAIGCLLGYYAGGGIGWLTYPLIRGRLRVEMEWNIVAIGSIPALRLAASFFSGGMKNSDLLPWALGSASVACVLVAPLTISLFRTLGRRILLAANAALCLASLTWLALLFEPRFAISTSVIAAAEVVISKISASTKT